MKLFTAPGSLILAERERHALQFVADYAGIPVPRLIRFGQIPAEPPVPYLIMTRLPGVRWGDRRVHLSQSESTDLHRRIGRLLRRFHAESPRIKSKEFGGVLDTDPGWSSLVAAVDHQCRHLTTSYRRDGGSADLAQAVEAFVVDHRDVLLSCPEPVLCHNDFIGGNLLITETGWPDVTGVTDFDRASFFDPAADLAQTLRHATQHEPAGAGELLAAYGIDEDGRRRLAVHRVLLTLSERIWVNGDRPAGWRHSVDRLDRLLQRDLYKT